MIRIENPVAGVGEPIEVYIDNVDADFWKTVSGVLITLRDDEEDSVTVHEFPAQTALQIPTHELASGSYDLTVRIVGTPIEVTEAVFIGAPDVAERVGLYMKALETERRAKEHHGERRTSGLLEARQLYTDLGLADLAEEVDKEIRPFDEARPRRIEYWAHGKRKKARARVRLRTGEGLILVRTSVGKVVAPEKYFTSISQLRLLREPLLVTGLEEKIDVLVNCSGPPCQHS